MRHFKWLLCLLLLFSSEDGFTSQVSEATQKIIEASYIQSGLKAQVDVLQRNATALAVRKIEAANLKVPFEIATVGYKIVRDRAISFNFKGKRITLREDSAYISWSW